MESDTSLCPLCSAGSSRRWKRKNNVIWRHNCFILHIWKDKLCSISEQERDFHVTSTFSFDLANIENITLLRLSQLELHKNKAFNLSIFYFKMLKVLSKLSTVKGLVIWWIVQGSQAEIKHRSVFFRRRHYRPHCFCFSSQIASVVWSLSVF